MTMQEKGGKTAQEQPDTTVQKEPERFVVTMSGPVTMWHRSGRQMVLTDKLHVRPWGALPAGRNLVMNCDSMVAEFGPRSEDETATVDEAAGGPRLGRLEFFHATGKVHAVDDVAERVEIQCHRILFKRESDVAIIHGWPTAPAVATRFDKARGTLHTARGSKIIWQPRGNYLRVMDARTVGGR